MRLIEYMMPNTEIVQKYYGLDVYTSLAKLLYRRAAPARYTHVCLVHTPHAQIYRKHASRYTNYARRQEVSNVT